MKRLIAILVISFALVHNVSADRNRNHVGAGYNNHHQSAKRHIFKQAMHYNYKRYNNHNRRYVSYARPYRPNYYRGYYPRYNTVIVIPSVLVIF